MTKKIEKKEARTWGSFEQWKDDLFPNDTSNGTNHQLDLDKLAVQAAQQSMAEVATKLQQR